MAWDWIGRLGRRRPTGAAPLEPATAARSYADALIALGFDAGAYREAYPMLAALSDHDLAAHYHASGRVERFEVRFAAGLRDGADRIASLGLSEAEQDLLRLDLAAAELCQADAWGRDDARTADLLRSSPAHRPLLVIGDSHGMLYLSEEMLRSGRLLPAPFLCTGASARGLGNPTSRARAGERIRGHLAAWGERLGEGAVLFKFGQVDLEFVYDYRRIREARRPFDMAQATRFAAESAQRYVDFVQGLRDLTSAPFIVTGALPPALSDEALREGYINAHIVELHAELGADDLRRELLALDMPDWRTRTELAGAYNQALAAACADAGLAFHDDFTPLVGADAVIDPELIVWHGGTDHHLCFTSPAARRAVSGFAAEIAQRTAR